MPVYDDSWTKDALLAEAQAQGLAVTAANTKAQILDALNAANPDAPQVGELVTTTMTKDYLGVALVNAVPGTSQATDRLGRSVMIANKDFLGRALVP